VRKPFLTARWEDLVLVTYRIGADLLTAQLPAGLEADRRPGDPAGTAYVSLVAFRFLDTRVKGVAVPLHRDFPEVNLRAYVRTLADPRRRGVLFISELVPKPAITMVANLVYHEHYRTVPMECEAVDVAEHRRRMSVTIELGDRVHRIACTGGRPAQRTTPGSVEHFFKELEWGFGRDAEGELVTYRVAHPVWRAYPCTRDDLELDVSFLELYGEPWSVLDDAEPCHVMFAEGSEITVFDREPRPPRGT
jgi:hypothetical protein